VHPAVDHVLSDTLQYVQTGATVTFGHANVALKAASLGPPLQVTVRLPTGEPQSTVTANAPVKEFRQTTGRRMLALVFEDSKDVEAATKEAAERETLLLHVTVYERCTAV